MDSSGAPKNTSLSQLDNEEQTNFNVIPTRKALTSVKRPKQPGRLGKLNLKPIPLISLTQEILESENEPIKEVSEAEESEPDAQDKCYTENCNELLSPVHEEDDKRNISNDLGVSWLQTPARTGQCNRLTATTPIINCHKASTLKFHDFVTPFSIRTIKGDKSVNKPKIQCSLDVRGLLQTPVNNLGIGSSHRTCQSLTKLSGFRNGINDFRNITSDNIICSARVNNAKVKSKISDLNSVLYEKNKENTKPLNQKVQFSLPSQELSDNTFKEITVKNITYIVLNQLGKGGSSVVYHCFDVNTKSERAIKKVNLDSDISAAQYINEVKVLERLQECDRIVTMYDYEIVESEKLLLVVLERGGLDLSRILKDLSNTNRHLPKHMLIFYWMEMLYAVKQIHENGIIHSDLKPANFLKAEAGLKLIDFGISSYVQDDMTSVVKSNAVGSFNYISPEALTNEPSHNCDSPSYGKLKYKVSYKSDVWSLGCILYQLVYRKTPFQHINHSWAKLSAIVDPHHKIDYPQVEWVSSKIVETIKKCLQFDMRARPSVDDLIQEYENIYK